MKTLATISLALIASTIYDVATHEYTPKGVDADKVGTECTTGVAKWRIGVGFECSK